MTFKTWIFASAVAAFAAALPQTSQARFGPSETVAANGASAVTKASDNFSGYRSGGVQRYRHFAGGNRYRYRGSRHRRYYGQRGRYYGGFLPNIVVGIPPITLGWGYRGYYPGDYYPPRVIYRRHRPVRRHYARGLEPWTAAWVRSCSARYRTFNPRTGYYFYKVGRKRFCR